MHAASTVELIWTAGAVAGLAVNAWALGDALTDLRYLQARGLNGAREVVARGNLRDEGLRCLIQLAFIAIGIIAMATPPPQQRAVSDLGLVIAGTLLAAEGVMVAKSLFNRRDRRRVLRILAARETDASRAWDGTERREP